MSSVSPIRPEGIRVWRGFRNSTYQQDASGFYQKLGSVFVPLTVQAMDPLGLKCYLPAILPVNSQGLPDEIALVGYENASDYENASHHTVIGRAYGDLHGTLFNFDSNSSIPVSRSGFPRHFNQESWDWKQPYFFVGAETDWQQAKVMVVVIPLVSKDINKNTQQVTEFYHLMQDLTHILGIKEVISVADGDYILAWIAVEPDSDFNPAPLASFMEGNGDSQCLVAESLMITPMWTANDGGVNVMAGHCYNTFLKTQASN